MDEKKLRARAVDDLELATRAVVRAGKSLREAGEGQAVLLALADVVAQLDEVRRAAPHAERSHVCRRDC